MAWNPEQRKKYFQIYTQKHKNDPAWKASQRNRQRRKRHKMKRLLIAVMGGACVRCGFSEHIFALEFDHLDPANKKADPSYLISSGTYRQAHDYITKNCQLLCANCHALKTVAFADNLRGNNISDTTEEQTLFANPNSQIPIDISTSLEELDNILNPKPLPKHGTFRNYTEGCRCEVCVRVGRAYHKKWRDSRQAKLDKP